MQIQSLGKLLAGLFAAAVIGINIFTINCGFPPTEIGLHEEGSYEDDSYNSEERQEAADKQRDSMYALVSGNSVVIADSIDRSCVSFETYDPSIGRVPCTVREQNIADGEITPPASGKCSIAASFRGDGQFSYRLLCDTDAGLPCKPEAGWNEIASLVTSFEFAALQADPAALDGYVIDSEDDSGTTLTFHAGNTYCSDTFPTE